MDVNNSPQRPQTSVLVALLETVGWTVIAALAVAAGGFYGHQIGSRVYPQRHEGMPSDIFFVPLGLILGVVVAVMTKIARPRWRLEMFGVIGLASIGYGGLLYEYSRGHARPGGFRISFAPDPVAPVRCDGGATCPPANPPLQWAVEGSMRVEETVGIGGTVKSISLSSYDRAFEARLPRQITREDAAERRSLGPEVTLEGRDIEGSRRIRPHEIVSYPLRYYYRTSTASPERDIRIHVDFTDAVGNWVGSEGQWKVR